MSLPTLSWPSRSLPKMTGAVCGALAIAVGAIVVLVWARDLPWIPIADTAGLALSGMALLGIVLGRPRFTFIVSAMTAAVAAASLFDYPVHFNFMGAASMPPLTALCFLVLATAFALSPRVPPSISSPALGVAGVLIAAVGAAFAISAVWGSGDAFNNWTRIALPTALGFLLLGFGAVAAALNVSQARLQQPAWAPIGAGLFLATTRVGLLREFTPKNSTGLSSTMSWLGALFGSAAFGIFVHFALKANLQRELLRRLNRRLEEEMLERSRAERSTQTANEHLEQRVEERTGALAAANEELHKEIGRREAVEEDLRQQKEILQSIFDHLPVMINFVDQNNQLRLVNREFEQTLGWSVEEIQSQNIDILAEGYPDPEYREQVRDFVTNSNAEWADFKTTVRDGRVIDTSWAMLHLSDGTGIGIGQDITKRKRAEEALRESEERFRQLAENIQDLFWIKTPDFKRVLYFSPEYENVTGRSPQRRYQDEDYQPFLHMIVPEDRERMAEIIGRGAETEFEIEFRIWHPDGSVRWIRDRGFPIRDQSGQIYRIAGIAHDITERKLAEDALRESEERFRQLAENIREVFWLRSPDLKQLLYVSPMYEKVCGRTCESLHAAGPEMVVHPDDRAYVMEIMPSFAGREFEIEYRIVTKEGDVRWLRDRGFPIRNQQGEIYRMGGVADDITDRKNAADRLKASSEQLRALSASLQSAREMEAARIAHQIHDDLGGILTGLRWELETLEKMIQEPADPEHLKTMRDKLATMLGLIDTTINVVRRIASELRPSILDDLGLGEAVEWQTQQFQARTGIECRSECAPQSIQLTDQQSTSVFRIVQEALTNILRHAQATRVSVAMQEEDGNLVLKVSDNGRGITPAEVSNKKSLGLLGMRERAHLIGGHLDIGALSEGGTVLRVSLPLAGGAN